MNLIANVLVMEIYVQLFYFRGFNRYDTLKTLLNTLFVLFLLIVGKTSFSQTDSILSLPVDKQVIALWKQYYTALSQKDSSQVMQELQKAENFYSSNKPLRRQLWLMQYLYRAESELYNPIKGASIMLDAAEAANKKGWDLIEAECWHYAGSFYFKGEKYGSAFEYMLKAQHVFEKMEMEDYPYILRYADAIAVCYYHFGEYREAIHYLNKIVPLSPDLHSLIYFPSVYNTMGLCYQQLKVYDTAAIWYRKSYETAAMYQDSFYMGLSGGNLGFAYYLQNMYDEALPLLQTDHISSLKAKEWGSATNAAITLASIYIKKGQPDSAEKYMKESRDYVYGYGPVQLRKMWYENMFYISKAKKDYSKMELYADSLLAYKDSVAQLQDKKIFNQTVLKLESEKYMNEVNQLESKRKQQIMLRNSLLIGIVLLAIIALLWVNRQLLKRNKEKELAGQKLLAYTEQLKEKNILLERLRTEMDQSNINDQRIGVINNLLESTILTDDDWRKFRQLFEKVYPGFFIRLKEKMPDLSPADTRLIALTKLQLAQKDMAPMLGVSYDAVRKAKQRLRKKINLPEEGDLEELVEMI